MIVRSTSKSFRWWGVFTAVLILLITGAWLTAGRSNGTLTVQSDATAPLGTDLSHLPPGLDGALLLSGETELDVFRREDATAGSHFRWSESDGWIVASEPPPLYWPTVTRTDQGIVLTGLACEDQLDQITANRDCADGLRLVAATLTPGSSVWKAVMIGRTYDHVEDFYGAEVVGSAPDGTTVVSAEDGIHGIRPDGSLTPPIPLKGKQWTCAGPHGVIGIIDTNGDHLEDPIEAPIGPDILGAGRPYLNSNAFSIDLETGELAEIPFPILDTASDTARLFCLGGQVTVAQDGIATTLHRKSNATSITQMPASTFDEFVEAGVIPAPNGGVALVSRSYIITYSTDGAIQKAVFPDPPLDITNLGSFRRYAFIGHRAVVLTFDEPTQQTTLAWLDGIR